MYPGLALAGQPPANCNGKGRVKVGGVLLLGSPRCSADTSGTCTHLLSTKRSTEQLREGLPPIMINLAEEPTLQPVSMRGHLAHLWTLTAVLPTADVNVNISVLIQR